MSGEQKKIERWLKELSSDFIAFAEIFLQQSHRSRSRKTFLSLEFFQGLDEKSDKRNLLMKNFVLDPQNCTRIEKLGISMEAIFNDAPIEKLAVSHQQYLKM